MAAVGVLTCRSSSAAVWGLIREGIGEELSNKREQRSRRSGVRMKQPLQLGGPLTRGVRRPYTVEAIELWDVIFMLSLSSRFIQLVDSGHTRYPS